MLLWIAFALMTAAALAAVLLPLARPARRDELDSGALAVYRHQLEEIEDERTRGLVDNGEAAGARVEVARRLLASADRMDAQSPPPPLPESKRATVALATAAAIPLFTLALYLTHGSPGLPSFPATARTQMPIERAQISDLVAKVEARLREHPEDGDGWDVIAPVYYKLERFRDAANAYARAARLKGETVRRLAGLAEVAVLAADGIVTEEARAAYERILALEPGRPEPRFWLALAKEQDGKLEPTHSPTTAPCCRTRPPTRPGAPPWRAASPTSDAASPASTSLTAARPAPAPTMSPPPRSSRRRTAPR